MRPPFSSIFCWGTCGFVDGSAAELFGRRGGGGERFGRRDGDVAAMLASRRRRGGGLKLF